MRTRFVGCGLLAALACAPAAAQILEELVVSATRDLRSIDISDGLSPSPDPARLLRNAPGANVTTNGPITGIPQYRGLFGPRIAVTLDGNLLAPAGPNWMDPPISYAVTAQLERLEVYRGIAPVSIAQEALGGAIDARTRRMDFTDSSSFELQGRVMGSVQSVNSGHQVDGEIQLANDQHRLRAAFMEQEGDDLSFPGGEILPSTYERQRFDAGYGFRWGDHRLQIDYGHNDTGEAGTPALPMDIDYFKGDLASVRYEYAPSKGLALSATLYGSDLDHGMTNYGLRKAPASPGRWRQNIATTENRGFKLQVDLNTDGDAWRAGIDGFREMHNSNVDNPNNPAFFVVNFNNAERDVLGVYLERDRDLGNRWRGELGLRVNRVQSDAEAVDATPAMMMPAARALRDAFNSADRDRSEINVDVVAKLRYQPTDSLSLYAGIAQKQRGPSYQERYLWLPLEATAGLADGQLYMGNVNLDSERSRQFELGLDFAGQRVHLHPRAFYYHVDDFIQGTPTAPAPANMFVSMMNAMNAMNRATSLQFHNVEAQLYGFDMDWSWRLSNTLSLGGLVNIVRGERRDVDDDLYRIAPDNVSLRLLWETGPLSAIVETIAYADQDAVSATNREQRSPGYGTVNLRGVWRVSGDLELAVGIDNLFDREYAPHLGGYNRAANPDVPMMARLPDPGLNVFGRVSLTF